MMKGQILFTTNILDYYRSRPQRLESISLYKFASYYVKANNALKKTAQERIYIEKYDIYMRKLSKFRVARHPHYNRHTEDYYCYIYLPGTLNLMILQQDNYVMLQFHISL